MNHICNLGSGVEVRFHKPLQLTRMKSCEVVRLLVHHAITRCPVRGKRNDPLTAPLH